MQRFNVFLFSLMAVAIFGLLVALPQPVAAVEFDESGSIKDNIDLATNNANPEVTAIRLVNIVLGLLGLIAVVLVLYAGFLWMLSGGNSDKIQKARGMLLNAVIGLLIILAAYGITKYVFDELNKATGAYYLPVEITEVVRKV